MHVMQCAPHTVAAYALPAVSRTAQDKLRKRVRRADYLQVTEAELDTDNLQLDNASGDTFRVAIDLEALAVSGTCIDVAARMQQELYPRGTQLTLGTPQQPDAQGTLVMSNLGYFQLKAAPGARACERSQARRGRPTPCLPCVHALARSLAASAAESAEFAYLLLRGHDPLLHLVTATHGDPVGTLL